jgi:NitT/TauT family transport system substrate-binding protein
MRENGGRGMWRTVSLIAVILLATGAARAQPKHDVPIEKMNVSMAHVPTLVYAGLYVAVERGYFEARGLEVNLVNARGGDTAYQVAGGTIEFAGGSPDSAYFNSIARGLPLTALASLALTGNEHSTTPLMLRKDLYDAGAMTTIAQLKGRKVANLAPAGITEYLLALALKSGGLTLADIDYVTPMGFPQIVDALTTQAVDAALLAEPFATIAKRKEIAVVVNDTSDLNEQILWIQTNSDFAKQHRNAVVNFLIGYLEGARDVSASGFGDPAIGKILEKFTKVPPDLIAAAVAPVIPPDGALNLESIMKQQAFHMSRGHLTYKSLIPPDRFIDRSYLDSALAYLGPVKK